MLKPYLDTIETRSRMLQNIERVLDEDLAPAPLEQHLIALLAFYRNPPGPGMQYAWNHLWVLSSEFNRLYTRMEKLLWEGIGEAKQPKTALKRRLEAAELAIQLWTEGHHFDEETGMPKIVPIPTPPSPTEEDARKARERARASANATWRRGNTNS